MVRGPVTRSPYCVRCHATPVRLVRLCRDRGGVLRMPFDDHGCQGAPTGCPRERDPGPGRGPAAPHVRGIDPRNLVWGLVVRSDPQVGGELSRVLAESGGDGVRALTIVTQQTFTDGLVSVLTLGIYGRRTTFLRGSIVRPRAGIVADIHSNRRGEEGTLTSERRVRPNLVVLPVVSG